MYPEGDVRHPGCVGRQISLMRVSETNDASNDPHISLTVQVCIWHLSAHSNV